MHGGLQPFGWCIKELANIRNWFETAWGELVDLALAISWAVTPNVILLLAIALVAVATLSVFVSIVRRIFRKPAADNTFQKYFSEVGEDRRVRITRSRITDLGFKDGQSVQLRAEGKRVTAELAQRREQDPFDKESVALSYGAIRALGLTIKPPDEHVAVGFTLHAVPPYTWRGAMARSFASGNNNTVVTSWVTLLTTVFSILIGFGIAEIYYQRERADEARTVPSLRPSIQDGAQPAP